LKLLIVAVGAAGMATFALHRSTPSHQLGPRRLRFTDDQRVRLAAKAKQLCQRVLREIGTIVSPDTLLE